MKKSVVSSLLLLSTVSLFSQTTMCFKENHSSMSTIENTKLNGGECNSQNSVTDMKNQGWLVDDIKITTGQNGMNFIYIFKKPSSSNLTNSFNTNESQEDMEKRILAKLEKKREIEKKEKEVERKIHLAQKGKTLYTKKCQSCHGVKGEEKAYGTSRALNTLSVKDMSIAISSYQLDSYDNGNGNIMKPIANSIVEDDLKNIEQYLKSIN